MNRGNEAKADNPVDPDLPLILPRSVWDNSPSLNALMTWPPQKDELPSDWQPVERIVLHDTGCDASNPSCNNNQDPISTIQGIYRYHAVTRGWGDIGYNYLIDQQGRIYEGRYGGNGSRAAHLYYDRTKDNFNFGSVGITVLGNYATIQPSATVYESLAKLVGWLSTANNLNPQGVSSSYIWNKEKGGFNTLFTGPVVLGHKDIEKGNPDPASFNFEKIRSEAMVWAQKYKNYTYETNNGNPKVYKLESGTRKVFESLADYTGKGNSYSKMAYISQAQLDIFSETRFLKYPDGSLLQCAGDPAIYIISEGKRRNFAVDAKQFVKLGFDFKAVRQVTQDELQKYQAGDPIKYGPDKSLLSDGIKIYLIQDGKKRWIPSGNLFTFLGYKWNKVKTAPTELVSYLESDFLTYPDGTLVKAENGSAIFLVDKGKLKPFLSAEIFTNLNYKWAKVSHISPAELAYYPQSDSVKYSEGALIRPKNSNSVYLISGGGAQPIDGATFKKKKYSWKNVLVVADSDFNALYGTNQTLAVISPPSASVASASSTPSVSAQNSAVSIISAVPKMRVAIYEVKDSNASFSANSDFNVLNKQDQIIAVKKAGEKYIYEIPVNKTEAFVKIAPQAIDAAVEVISFEEHPAWKPSLNYNQFRGSVEVAYSVKSGKIWVVNELLLEDYLKGIAEVSQGDSMEYLKTMMVSARTYAYYYILQKGKYGANEVYYLTKTTSDQLYKGYAREILSPDIQQSANATRGEIVVFNGLPIISAYSSGAAELKTAGSKSACSIWGGKFCEAGFVYLGGGVKDPVGTEYNYSSCTGANHCVGLSGAGTRQFAKTGAKNYQEILRYYYKGVGIKKLY